MREVKFSQRANKLDQNTLKYLEIEQQYKFKYFNVLQHFKDAFIIFETHIHLHWNPHISI